MLFVDGNQTQQRRAAAYGGFHGGALGGQNMGSHQSRKGSAQPECEMRVPPLSLSKGTHVTGEEMTTQWRSCQILAASVPARARARLTKNASSVHDVTAD